MFITSDYSKPEKGSNIYTDLAEALKNNNHDIKVVVTEEKKKIDQTTLFTENNIPVLRVKTGNLYEVSFVEKALTFLTLSRSLKKGIEKFFDNEKFDLVLFQSPPLTMCSVVKWAMKKYKCPSYLMMKDIFPQNGVDIGLYSKKSPIYKYFRYREKGLYKISSKIGCMSEGNINYLLEHNKFLDKDKLEIFPNTVKITNQSKVSKTKRKKIRAKYGLNEDDVVAIYGGNFGRPQGLDFLLDVLRAYKNKKNVKFILIGRGTEKAKIFNEVNNNGYKNVLTYDFMPRDDYEALTRVCDIGLIFLDKRFTIPNYPSKTLSYFECSLPIMAAIDKNTDYSKLLEDVNCGFWVENGDIKSFKNKFNQLLKDKKLRSTMGDNGHQHLVNEWNVEKSVKIIERYLGEKNV
ncbi:MAG: glycosyltransferase family 4 protein [Bacilli bacterium]|nr:glycosyltransferase family 4 protein [Bacilli bacterium]